MKLHPKQMVKMPEIETEAYKYVIGLIDSMQKIGIASQIDHKKMIKKYDRWLLKYGLKFKANDGVD